MFCRCTSSLALPFAAAITDTHRLLTLLPMPRLPLVARRGADCQTELGAFADAVAPSCRIFLPTPSCHGLRGLKITMQRRRRRRNKEQSGRAKKNPPSPSFIPEHAYGCLACIPIFVSLSLGEKALICEESAAGLVCPPVIHASRLERQKPRIRHDDSARVISPRL